jgi:hypothetical protein
MALDIRQIRRNSSVSSLRVSLRRRHVLAHAELPSAFILRSDNGPDATAKSAKMLDRPMNAQIAATAAAAATSPSLILLREDHAGIAVLTLNRPQARNSLSEATLEALSDALTAIAHERAIRVVILTANGPAFSAGHDLKELNAHARRRSRPRLFQAHHGTVQQPDAADRHAAAAGHRRGAGNGDGGGLPAGGEL